MPNSKSLTNFLLVDFVKGYLLLLVVMTGGKTKSTLLTWTVLYCLTKTGGEENYDGNSGH